MKKYILILTLSIAILLSSCSSRLLVSSGAKSNEPLIFNGEYKFDTLEPIKVTGKAIFGIPTSSHLGPYKNKNGFLFTFNGLEVGRTPKILPILTMVTFSFYSARLVQAIGGYEYSFRGSDPKISFIPAVILGLPIAGATNNLLWQSSAFSGASSCFRYRLIEENPDIDLFVYPKYKVEYNSGIWTQSSSLIGSAIGASLIINPLKPMIQTPIQAPPLPAIPDKPVKPEIPKSDTPTPIKPSKSIEKPSVTPINNSESSTIKSTRVQVNGTNLDVMSTDFSVVFSWSDAIAECKKLGNGWRLPTKEEMSELVNNETLSGLKLISDGKYWCVESYDEYYAWSIKVQSDIGTTNYYDKSKKFFVRPVKTVQ